MPIVGAFVRVQLDSTSSTRADLDALSGVETFDLDNPGKIGLIIEAATMDAVNEILSSRIPAIGGVMGVWPVYANTEDLENQPDRAASSELIQLERSAACG